MCMPEQAKYATYDMQIDGISPASAAASLTQGSAGVSKSRKEGDRDTFDLPSAPSDAMPPAVDPSSTFHVVLGCEVLYETPHAQWVAAAIKLRMKHGGRAWIAGAVRDSKVWHCYGYPSRFHHFKGIGNIFSAAVVLAAVLSSRAVQTVTRFYSLQNIRPLLIADEPLLTHRSWYNMKCCHWQPQGCLHVAQICVQSKCQELFS